jgi:asparagine synthase (glutamine-hydrolysing)
MAHERLSIVDVDSGAQPLISEDGNLILCVNGEIYNHKDLRKELKGQHKFQTESDCEIILHLYEDFGSDCVKMLNGIFAFVLYDKKNKTYLIARDHIGIIPLYRGWDAEGQLHVASEMKALIGYCEKFEEMPPAHYYHKDDGELTRYWNPEWRLPEKQPTKALDEKALRESLEKCVKHQMMSDVPYGVLISGGVDSSVISAIVSKYAKKRIEDGDNSEAWWPQLHSFAVGLEGGPDLKYAQKVADYIGCIHHETHFTIQEGLDAISDVIYHLETYDVTSIRAATPMYLLSRKIKSMGIKMVFSGEGADEIFGGYLYFHKAPNAKEFHEELVRKIDNLHMYDCLRANKSTAAWGVEARVPFLDDEFLKVAMNIDPQEKMITKDKMEKHILRKAFDGYIPDEILYRQKEQFSDGVGYSWIDSIREVAENKISDEMFTEAEKRYPINAPVTKEGFYFRSIFEGHFPGDEAANCVPGGPSIACSTPTAIKWDESFKNMADPSGRAIKSVHADSY